MKLLIKLILLGIILLGYLFADNPATAMVSGDLQELRVISHHFTTAISNRSKMISSKNPSQGRYIVLKLSATSQKGDGKIFANDFVLRYFHSDGSEDRAQCEAIVSAKTAEAREFGDEEFNIGSNGSWRKFNSGKMYFGLAFFIERDVEMVELHRVGAEPLTYRIGTDKPYSVSIFSNAESKLLSEAKEIIQAGGYSVSGSETLIKEEKGVTIHYREQAESQAREISQRLMTKFGVVPAMKKMELISAVDIVVWLGK